MVLLALAVLALGVFAAPTLAQTNKASIVGVVRDQSDAVVPNAKVTVTNVATNQSREIETNDNGEYVAALLDVGTYKVEAAASGFATATVEDIILQTADRLAIDLTLQPEGTREEVTISASDEPLVQRESSSRSDTITGRQIVELPLNGRNFTELATLAPGVTRALGIGPLTDATALNGGDPNAGGLPGQNSVGSTEASRFSRSGGASISANGQRPTNNNFSLDGVDNNEATFGTIGVFPPPDAIAEFKVETSVPRAESGRAAGAVVNTSFRSGTNEFHGSVYYYGQNSALNATHPIINGKPLLTNDPAGVARFRANNKKAVQQVHEFGATIGGPIFKDRTFFFADYQGQRNNFPAPFSTAVPTVGSRVGDFSDFDTQVLDPITREPFPNNIIPNLQGRDDFSPAAFAFLNLYPLPTINIRNPTREGNPNYFILRKTREVIDAFDVKIDHRFSDSNNITGRYSFNDQVRRRDSVFPQLPAGFGAGDENGNTRQIVLNDVHTFTPTVLNEFRFGWTRVEIDILNPGVDGTQNIPGDLFATIGVPNVNRGSFETTGAPLIGMEFGGSGGLEFVGDGGPFIVHSDNFYYADSLTVISGSHTIKGGFEFRNRRIDTIDGGRAGNLKGHIQFTGGDPGHTGNVQADVLLQVPSAFGQSADIPGGPFELRQNEFSLFVQDDWKVNPSLTLNYGLRWDYFPAATEASARISNFDIQTGTVILADDAGDSLVNADKDNFGPRIGAAWTFGPDNRMVLRGGYGLVYTLDGLDRYPLNYNPPFTNSVLWGGDAGVTFETGPVVATEGIDPLNLRSDASYFFVEPEQKSAFVHQFNLTFEWNFAENWVGDIAYVGNRSRNLLATRNIGAGGSGLGLARNAAGVFLENVTAFENRAKSWYDALQTQIQRRFANGFQARGSYTFSKTLDTSTGVFSGPGETRGSAGGPINPFDLEAGEKGYSSLHVAHLFTGNFIWEIPVGKGRKYLDNGGVANYIVGGWQANMIFNARSGYPFSAVASGSNGTRPDIVGDPYAGAPAGRFLNRDAFEVPANRVTNLAGRSVLFGNIARNSLVGPGYFRADASLLKNFAITENVKLEFGVQFFNLFNSADYLVPNSDINSGDFGLFFGALNARQLQYRAKVSF
jgi:hypothetical protein